MRASIKSVAQALYDCDHADTPCPREDPLWDDEHWCHVIGKPYLDMATAAARTMLAGIAGKSLRAHIALAMFGEEGIKLAAET